MKISLKVLRVKHLKKEYVSWFLDKKVLKYSNNQYRKFTLSGQKKYILKCIKNKNMVLYGIFLGNLHIGNITLNGIISKHKRGEITYVIGNKKYRNLGIANNAIKQIIGLAKKKYKLKKLVASCVKENIGSKKALERNKFILEGKRKKHLFFNNRFYDQIDYGLIIK